MKKTKKAISVLLSLVLLPGVLPASALASETGQSVPVCICDTLCTGENINQDCPVCGAEGADLARCAGTGESGTGLPTDTEPSTGTEPAAQTCICDTLCTDGSVNGGCPVCGGEGADLSKCLGKQVAEPTPEATPEPTQETTPEPTPETTPGPTPEAPEQAEATDEADAAVAEVQAQIDALPAADGLAVMSQEEQQAVYTQVQAAYDAYNALTDEQKGQIAGTEIFDSLFGVFNGMVNALAENVTYLDADGQMQNCESAMEVTAELIAWENGWYVVSSDVTIDSRVAVTGDVYLILADGYTLTVNGGINLSEGNSITIYAQSRGDEMGTLTAQNAAIAYAGIGGNEGQKCGTITVNGGTINVRGGWQSSGIGGGFNGHGGNVTINNGIVTAAGGPGGTGIGGGYYGDGGTVVINGGIVTATAEVDEDNLVSDGAGIGGGLEGDGADVTINGGVVTAVGKGYGAGIGGSWKGNSGTCSINNNAFVFAVKGSYNSGLGIDDNNTAGWNGTVFQGDKGMVYGKVSLEKDIAIPENYALTIPEGNALTVPLDITLYTEPGVILDNYGTINGKGVLDGKGILYLRGDGSVADTVTNNLKTIDVMKTETTDGKTYYLIENAEQLVAFSNIVNNTLTEEEAQVYTPSTAVNGKLVANIDLNPGFTFASDGSYTGPEGVQPKTWTPIGVTSNSTGNPGYKGTFDGDGFAVSGVYINNTDNNCQGLFGHINGTVRNLRLENSSITSSENNVGGIAGINRGGQMESCVFSGFVQGAQRVGGIAGRNMNSGTVINCYNTGTIRATLYGNGIVGSNESTVKNCFTTTGSVAGGGTVTNCYFMSNSSSAAEALTAVKMSGLNAVTTMGFDSASWSSGGKPQWKETELGSMGLVNVLCGYLPHPSVFDGKQEFDWVPIGSDVVMRTQTDEDDKTYYLIENAAQLASFRNIVNGTLTAEEAQFYTPDASANGRLVNDIDLNPGYTFNADGTYTYSGEGEPPGVQSWTPIGWTTNIDNEAYIYKGTFDGNGHTINGVYINNDNSYQGLFGFVSNSGIIQQLGVINSYVSASICVGAIVGVNRSGTIQNCYNTGFVRVTSNARVGGLVGWNWNGTVQNSYNTGAVSSGSASSVGGVVGYNTGTVQNCYNVGTITGGGNIGSMAGQNSGTITNCYYLDTSASAGIGSGDGQVTSFTAEQMTGSAALGQEKNQMNLDTTVWTAGDDTTSCQDTGTMDENGKKVFVVMAKLPQLTVFVEMGKGHEFLQVGTITASLSTQTDGDGKTYYLIHNKEELETFQDIVNGNLTDQQRALYPEGASANGRLEADIDLNPGYTFAADGTYTYSGEAEAPGLKSWTPIGNSIRWYTGTFDGNDKTVSGIYINNGPSCQGLFGVVSGGTVKNLGVTNSCIQGYSINGGVVGYVDGSGTVTNCYNTGTVSSSETYTGGVVGYVGGGTVTNCYNTGAVTGSSRTGGVAGYVSGSTVTNCYNTGTVSGSIYIGGVVGNNASGGTVQNCYYLVGSAEKGIGTIDSSSSSSEATSLTVAQIESTGTDGLLAKLVGSVPDDEKTPWNTTLSAMGTWEYGKPAVQPVFTWQTVIQNAPTYSVMIPETATVDGNAVTVSADAGALRADQTVEVAVDKSNAFKMTNGGNDSVGYEVFVGESTAAVEAGGTVLSTGNTSQTAQVSVKFKLDSTPAYAGIYTGTCIFAVSVK